MYGPWKVPLSLGLGRSISPARQKGLYSVCRGVDHNIQAGSSCRISGTGFIALRWESSIQQSCHILGTVVWVFGSIWVVLKTVGPCWLYRLYYGT